MELYQAVADNLNLTQVLPETPGFLQDMEETGFIDPGMVGISMPADDECLLYPSGNYSGTPLSFRLGNKSSLVDTLTNYNFNDKMSSWSCG